MAKTRDNSHKDDWKVIIGKQIKVGAKSYAVKAMDRVKATDEGLLGHCSPFSETIEIAPDQSPGNAVNTLLHEVLHAIWHAYDLGDAASEEPAVTRLSTGLAAVFSDNPEFVAWIRGK